MQDYPRIVFLGTPEFAVESLNALVDNGFNVVGVVTMPDKPAGRGHKMFQSPVKLRSLELGIPVLQPVKLRDPEFIEQLQALQADLFIVIAFRMLPEVVWRMPRLGTFNLHASLLPRYRGAAPINWAVINGDTETGVTTFFLSHEIDTGDIIAQERVAINPEDNVGDVHDRLMALGARLTVDTVRQIVDGTLHTIPQDQLITAGEPATPAPKIFKDTCRIDWTQPAERIHNLVRGLSPYPSAWTELVDAAGNTITAKILATARKEVLSSLQDSDQVGHIQDNTLVVTCGDARELEIVILQPSGKRPMDAASFLRGLHCPITRAK
ncbi:MAG: methionyl-tRNA formyltransferase [Bacteroidales bacterium]|nr:methionyl-tRNA formyltransferase [Bacteroidales bacterium]